MNIQRLRKLTLAAVFAALIFLATTFLKLPVPLSNSGYVHVGDAFIFLAASLLPIPYAAASAAIGATLADITLGAAIWAPYTFIIKACMALLFTAKADRILTKQNILMSILSGIIGIVGYFFAEAVIAGNFIAPIASLITGLGLFQFLGSIVLYILLGYALDKSKIKNFINND